MQIQLEEIVDEKWKNHFAAISQNYKQTILSPLLRPAPSPKKSHRSRGSRDGSKSSRSVAKTIHTQALSQFSILSDEEPRISLLTEIINLTGYCVTGIKESLTDESVYQTPSQKIVPIMPSFRHEPTDYTIIQIFNQLMIHQHLYRMKFE